MVEMHGSSRVLDSAVVETGTSAARQIALYGVTSLSELVDKPLLVKSSNAGVANTTIQINNLTATSLKVMKNNVTIDTYANWIATGQLYFIMYNGNVFVAFPVGISSVESSGSEVFNIPIAVTELPNNATTAQMLTAFGTAQNQLDLQTAIEYGTSLITFEDELDPTHRIYLIETKFNSIDNTDTIIFAKVVGEDYKIIRQTYIRNMAEGASEYYTSLSVEEINVSNMVETVSGEGEKVVLLNTADSILFEELKVQGNTSQVISKSITPSSGHTVLNFNAQTHAHPIKITQGTIDVVYNSGNMILNVSGFHALDSSGSYFRYNDTINLLVNNTIVASTSVMPVHGGNAFSMNANVPVSADTQYSIILEEECGQTGGCSVGDSYSLVLSSGIYIGSTERTIIGPIENVTGNIVVEVANSEDSSIAGYVSASVTFPFGATNFMKGDYLADDGIHHVRGQTIESGITITLNDAKSNGEYLCDKKTAGNLVGKTLTFDTAVTDALIEYELEQEVIVPYTPAQRAAYNQIKALISYYGMTVASGSSSGINPILYVKAYKEGSSVHDIVSLIKNYTYGLAKESYVLEYAPKTTTLTIETTDWVLNSSTNNYEYTVTDASITANTSIEISMDLANQALFTDGYTESAAGSYKIITSTVPSASVTMTVKIQNTIAI